MTRPPSDRDLAAQLAGYVVDLEPMVIGWEVDEVTDTVRLTMPRNLGIAIDLAHLRRGYVDVVAMRVVRDFRHRAATATT